MSQLIFVNGLGPNYKGDNLYVQNSDFFSMVDAIDDVVSLAWESDDENKKRLVFRFGETEQQIKDKLYERDLILEFEKKVVYEN